MNKNIKALSLALLLSNAVLVTVVTRADAPKQVDSFKKSDVSKPVDAIKVGVVSATEIMMDTEIGKKASADIDATRQKYAQEIQADAQKIEKKDKDLIAKAPTMSESSKRTASLEIENDKKALELKNQNLMKALQADAQTAMEDLGKNFDKAVTKIAQETKTDMIFEKESGRIVYANPELDLTKNVKVSMNADFKATQVAAAKKDKATA